MKPTNRRTLPFKNSVYYFIALFVLVMGGIWPQYFAKFFDGTVDFTLYLHFHATVAMLWFFRTALKVLSEIIYILWLERPMTMAKTVYVNI